MHYHSVRFGISLSVLFGILIGLILWLCLIIRGEPIRPAHFNLFGVKFYISRWFDVFLPAVACVLVSAYNRMMDWLDDRHYFMPRAAGDLFNQVFVVFSLAIACIAVPFSIPYGIVGFILVTIIGLIAAAIVALGSVLFWFILNMRFIGHRDKNQPPGD